MKAEPVEINATMHDGEKYVIRYYREADYDALAAKYHELLNAVGNKYPGESRHETALRYIWAAEACPTTGTATGSTVGDAK